MWIHSETCMWHDKNIQSALVNLYPNEYSQELHYYRFAVNNCVESCDLPNTVCVPNNKKKDLNRYIFSLILGKNQSKTLTKYKSCEC